MFQLMATILAWFYELTANYALAIGLLTLTVMVLLLPLTLKATKSTIEMQRVQPELKRIQQLHKGDRQKMNEELMKLYQEHGINPLGGCLPILLQLPVFFIIYRVIRKLTAHCSQAMHDSLLKAGKTTCTVKNFWPSYLSHSTKMFKDLAKSTKMLSFGLDLSKSALEQLKSSFGSGVPYLALVLVVAGTSYYQQRQVMVRSSAQGQAMNSQQMMLLRVMPAFFALISLAFPSALIIYFLVSNLFRIAQQGYITHRFYRSEPEKGESTAELPKAPKPPKGNPAKAAPPTKAHRANKPSPPPRPSLRPKPKPKPSGPPPPTRPKPSGRVTPPKKKP